MSKRRYTKRDRQRVLLVNAPVYDIRLHWAKWQCPTTLLSLGRKLKSDGIEVKLLDCLVTGEKRLPRRQLSPVLSPGVPAIKRWRLGMPEPKLKRELMKLADEGWIPDEVVIECFTTFWWEGARESVQAVRSAFPKSRVSLVGAYGDLLPNHALEVSGVDEARYQTADPAIWYPDATLYRDQALVSQGLCYVLPSTTDSVAEFVEVLKEARAAGTEEFGLHIGDPPNLQVLEQLAAALESQKTRLSFDILGSLAPEKVEAAPELPVLLRRVGVKHVHFSDDRSRPVEETEAFIESCARATSMLHAAGYLPRTDAVTAGLCVGRRGEDLEERTRATALLSHRVGSLILWPYQPMPSELPDEPSPERHNGKLFPFKTANGHSYNDYAELIALNAVLNSRYRDKSFDFMGSSLVARLLSRSLAREAWNASDDVKGTLQLPMRAK